MATSTTTSDGSGKQDCVLLCSGYLRQYFIKENLNYNTNDISPLIFKYLYEKVAIKVGVVGDTLIGKTVMLMKYVQNKYDEFSETCTLGVTFIEKEINLKYKDVTISIWEVGGAKEFATLMSLVCEDAQVLLFCFDLAQKESLLRIKLWYKEAKKENKHFIPMIIGLKYDLFEKQENKYKIKIIKQTIEFGKKMKNAPILFVSSKMSINVEKIFDIIVEKVLNLEPKILDGNKNKVQNKNENKNDDNNGVIDIKNFKININEPLIILQYPNDGNENNNNNNQKKEKNENGKQDSKQ